MRLPSFSLSYGSIIDETVIQRRNLRIGVCFSSFFAATIIFVQLASKSKKSSTSGLSALLAPSSWSSKRLAVWKVFSLTRLSSFLRFVAFDAPFEVRANAEEAAATRTFPPSYWL